MGELLDSYYVSTYPTAKYSARTSEYLQILKDQVDIWEIGNEVNGEWLGQTADVVAKISSAYDLVHAQGRKTALTLYYNAPCFDKADHEMLRWSKENVPERLRKGLDFVFVSYYEDDCNGAQPEWSSVFSELANQYPNSKLGFGEMGTEAAAKKEDLLKRYYSMKAPHPRFVGGYFWWYFAEDMIPRTQPLWKLLNSLIN